MTKQEPSAAVSTQQSADRRSGDKDKGAETATESATKKTETGYGDGEGTHKEEGGGREQRKEGREDLPSQDYRADRNYNGDGSKDDEDNEDNEVSKKMMKVKNKNSNSKKKKDSNEEGYAQEQGEQEEERDEAGFEEEKFLPDKLPSLWNDKTCTVLSSPLKLSNFDANFNCGLRNLGNTCYMNSVLQALTHCPPLVYVFALNWDGAVPPLICDEGPLNPTRFDFVEAFARQMNDLWRGAFNGNNGNSNGRNTAVLNAAEVTKRMIDVAPEFQLFGQQDAQEALNYILNNLHDELCSPVDPKLHPARTALELFEMEQRELYWQSKQKRKHGQASEDGDDYDGCPGDKGQNSPVRESEEEGNGTRQQRRGIKGRLTGKRVQGLNSGPRNPPTRRFRSASGSSSSSSSSPSSPASSVPSPHQKTSRGHGLRRFQYGRNKRGDSSTINSSMMSNPKASKAKSRPKPNSNSKSAPPVDADKPSENPGESESNRGTQNGSTKEEVQEQEEEQEEEHEQLNGVNMDGFASSIPKKNRGPGDGRQGRDSKELDDEDNGESDGNEDSDEADGEELSEREKEEEESWKVRQVHSPYMRSIVSDAFQSLLAQQVKCSRCGNVSQQLEEYLELALALPTKAQLKDMYLSDPVAESNGNSSLSSSSRGNPSSSNSGASTRNGNGDRGSPIGNHDNGGSGPEATAAAAASTTATTTTGGGGGIWNAVKSFLGLAKDTLELDDCLRAFFSTEKLEGQEQYFCEVCDSKQDATKSYSLAHPPEVLSVHLKRFNKNAGWSGLGNMKNTTQVNFPVNGLDLKPFLHRVAVDAIEETNSTSLYDLFAVVRHSGAINHGHYIAACKNPVSQKWFVFDDDYIDPITEDALQGHDAYLLFYQKRSSRFQQQTKAKLYKSLKPHSEEAGMLQASSERDPTRGSNSANSHSGNDNDNDNGNDNDNNGMYFVPIAWIGKWETFTDPGPIASELVACEHGKILWHSSRDVHRRVLAVSAETWEKLVKLYGVVGPEITSPYICMECFKKFEALGNRRLKERDQIQQTDGIAQHTWYLIHTQWLKSWRKFVVNDPGPFGRGTWMGTPPPGPITNDQLLDEKGNPKPNMKKIVHYRGVNEATWKVLQGIYGGGPPIPRASIDLYEQAQEPKSKI